MFVPNVLGWRARCKMLNCLMKTEIAWSNSSESCVGFLTVPTNLEGRPPQSNLDRTLCGDCLGRHFETNKRNRGCLL